MCNIRTKYIRAHGAGPGPSPGPKRAFADIALFGPGPGLGPAPWARMYVVRMLRICCT